MSVAFARAVVDGLRHNDVPVKLRDGWERTGNGQTSNYQGLIWHHTASRHSNEPPPVLWEGRPNLRGPLCNSSGNADGSITIIAAHPANHAGASGGRSMGPLPTTRTFNRLTWGHEIVYPGTRPMTSAQRRSMLILAGVISGILNRPTAEWCRGHAETSITGKWDPGFAPGKTIDLAAARNEVWAALHSARVNLGDDMSAQFEIDVRKMWRGMTEGGLAELVRRYDAMETDLRSDLAVKGRKIDALDSKLDKVLALLAAHDDSSGPTT